MARKVLPKTDQTSVLHAIMHRTKTVYVGEHAVKLQACSPQKIVELRESLQGAKDKDSPTAGLELTAACVRACLVGTTIDQKQGMALVAASGGEWGELGQAALELCGFDAVMQKAMKQGDADPST